MIFMSMSTKCLIFTKLFHFYAKLINPALFWLFSYPLLSCCFCLIYRLIIPTIKWQKDPRQVRKLLSLVPGPFCQVLFFLLFLYKSVLRCFANLRCLTLWLWRPPSFSPLVEWQKYQRQVRKLLSLVSWYFCQVCFLTSLFGGAFPIWNTW